ncbi:hypothetical protein LEP1GSC047_2485 [Leptospira inadai serovar Lyme str. 10]|uniref:Uncharacterized protein n=1 Tax=Leptospira inadai serovar Lyme str. 10 TaxID=1049790 RepID=V6HNP6_9LEPT|nr:hypothetical protein [Leptospira inadai]EQA38510.1 hypothetical protein LEP1GSC047_2485 [Leptospira inadai serovar Lyme str. 10]
MIDSLPETLKSQMAIDSFIRFVDQLTANHRTILKPSAAIHPMIRLCGIDFGRVADHDESGVEIVDSEDELPERREKTGSRESLIFVIPFRAENLYRNLEGQSISGGAERTDFGRAK